MKIKKLLGNITKDNMLKIGLNVRVVFIRSQGKRGERLVVNNRKQKTIIGKIHHTPF